MTNKDSKKDRQKKRQKERKRDKRRRKKASPQTKYNLSGNHSQHSSDTYMVVEL